MKIVVRLPVFQVRRIRLSRKTREFVRKYGK